MHKTRLTNILINMKMLQTKSQKENATIILPFFDPLGVICREGRLVMLPVGFIDAKLKKKIVFVFVFVFLLFFLYFLLFLLSLHLYFLAFKPKKENKRKDKTQNNRKREIKRLRPV